MHKNFKLLFTAVAVVGGSQAMAADPYYYPPAHVAPPTYSYTYAVDDEHHCGGLRLYSWQWSAWYPVDMEDGVELQVRYKMKLNGQRPPKTFMQLRYVNYSQSVREVTVANVLLHFHDLTQDATWGGERIVLNPESTANGSIQVFDGQLCTWKKHYDVR